MSKRRTPTEVTVGPMRCQGCDRLVYWKARQFYSRFSNGYRRHNCNSGLGAAAGILMMIEWNQKERERALSEAR